MESIIFVDTCLSKRAILNNAHWYWIWLSIYQDTRIYSYEIYISCWKRSALMTTTVQRGKDKKKKKEEMEWHQQVQANGRNQLPFFSFIKERNKTNGILWFVLHRVAMDPYFSSSGFPLSSRIRQIHLDHYNKHDTAKTQQKHRYTSRPNNLHCKNKDKLGTIMKETP